jgi:hypothetical protein
MTMELDERHHLAISLLLQGASRKSVAEAVGIHPTRIWQWTQLPEFAAELQRQRESIRVATEARLAGEVERNVDTIIQLRDASAQDRVRLAAAQDLLDRADVRPPDVVHNVHEHVLSPEFAALLHRLRDEEDIVDGTVIDGVTQLPERIT